MLPFSFQSQEPPTEPGRFILVSEIRPHRLASTGESLTISTTPSPRNDLYRKIYRAWPSRLVLVVSFLAFLAIVNGSDLVPRSDDEAARQHHLTMKGLAVLLAGFGMLFGHLWRWRAQYWWFTNNFIVTFYKDRKPDQRQDPRWRPTEIAIIKIFGTAWIIMITVIGYLGVINLDFELLRFTMFFTSVGACIYMLPLVLLGGLWFLISFRVDQDVEYADLYVGSFWFFTVWSILVVIRLIFVSSTTPRDRRFKHTHAYRSARKKMLW